jgi:hypothetical protein
MGYVAEANMQVYIIEYLSFDYFTDSLSRLCIIHIWKADHEC